MMCGMPIGNMEGVPDLGRKVAARSRLSCTGSGGMCCIRPVMLFIWFRMFRMLSRKRTKSSVFSCTCHRQMRFLAVVDG